MGLNAQNNTDDSQRGELVGLDVATVTSVSDHTQGDDNGHYVFVEPEMFTGEQRAEVLVPQKGSVTMPQEGDGVLIGYRRNGKPVVLGLRYNINDSIPPFVAGERRIGASGTDSYIRIEPDDTITVQGNGSNVVIQPNGDVIIDSGSTKAITNVEAASTNSNGGITDLDITRSPSVYLPSP